MVLRWRNDNTRIKLSEEMLCSFLLGIQSQSITFHPTPAEGFVGKWVGLWSTLDQGLGVEGQILSASLYRSSLSTRVPGGRGLESGEEGCLHVQTPFCQSGVAARWWTPLLGLRVVSLLPLGWGKERARMNTVLIFNNSQECNIDVRILTVDPQFWKQRLSV